MYTVPKVRRGHRIPLNCSYDYEPPRGYWELNLGSDAQCLPVMVVHVCSYLLSHLSSPCACIFHKDPLNTIILSALRLCTILQWGLQLHAA